MATKTNSSLKSERMGFVPTVAVGAKRFRRVHLVFSNWRFGVVNYIAECNIEVDKFRTQCNELF